MLSNSLALLDTNVEEILSILSKLNRNKGAGGDGIRPKDLAEHAQILTPCITKLINNCFATGTIPIELKESIVRPIYKNGQKSDYSNYRPISILPVIEKVLEDVLVRRINGFVEKYSIIDDRQYGFQKGKKRQSVVREVCQPS